MKQTFSEWSSNERILFAGDYVEWPEGMEGTFAAFIDSDGNDHAYWDPATSGDISSVVVHLPSNEWAVIERDNLSPLRVTRRNRPQ